MTTQQSKTPKQTRYRIIAQTATGEQYELINVNLEDNIATYHEPNNTNGYLELDKVTLTMIDTQN